MANKFNNIGPLPVPQDLNARVKIKDLTKGARLDVSARAIPSGASPSLSNVRFDSGALRKDFGTSAVGAAAPAKILGIGEHKFVLNDVSFHRLIRLRRNGTQLVVDIWDGANWIETDISTESIADVYLSLASTQDRFLMADGNYILTWYESASTNVEENDFTAANLLIDVGDEVDAIVSPGGSIGDEYDVRFSVDLTITNGSDYTVTVALLHDGAEVMTRDFVLASGTDTWLDELFELVREIDDTETLTLQVKSIVPDVYPGKSVNWTDPGSTYSLEATKAEAAEAHDDVYTFRYDYTNTGASDSTIRYHVDTGSGWTLVTSQTLTPADDGTTIERPLLIAGAGAGTHFAVEVLQNGDGIQDASLPASGNGLEWESIQPGTDFDLEVHGYNKATDLDSFAGVTYTVSVPVTSVLEPLSPDAPAARFILPFGDRLLAYRDGGDPQVASWSADGDITDWLGGDSGSTVLLDTRSDGIDPIMGAAVVGPQVVAVFRARSIMRAQETGNVQLGMGHFHWIDELGTESPFSVQTTPLGVIFLGHDMQVYLLTEQGPNPIGTPIHTELVRRITSNADLVDSSYDSIFGEYYLGVPEDNASEITGIWIFDLTRFIETQELVWRYRPQAVQRFATVSLVE